MNVTYQQSSARLPFLINLKGQKIWNKKWPNKKIIRSAKFEAKEQFTKSALENLKTENERIVNSLKESGEIDY